MQIVREASEPEVVQYWLNREYENRSEVKEQINLIYSDWGEDIGRENFTDTDANSRRLEMLLGIRWFFVHFQKGVYQVKQWNLIKLLQEDLDRLLLINAEDRRQMSDGTLRPMDAAMRIESRTTFLRQDIRRDADFIRNNTDKLASDRSRIVVVGPENGSLTVVDGVHRITAVFLQYLVRQRGKFQWVEAFHGVSEGMYDYRFG